MLAGRCVLLGVTGGVAAYKSAYLARRLVEAGAEVRCIMTESAVEFLGPQTLAAITGNPPVLRWFGGETISVHTELARWADVIVVAPATAATLSRIANGLSDDLLSATILASRAPLVVAPAMHTEMWENAATRRNMELIGTDGHTVVGPADGPLAGGDIGWGRMAEPDEIVEVVVDLATTGPLSGRRVLVTAGGTRQPIDPVRYIGNHSSGKMGVAVANEAARRGAAVVLISTTVVEPSSGVEVVVVGSAEEMAEAVWDRAGEVDVAVLAAAVADFRPSDYAATKLKRAEGPPEIRLEPTPDILRGVAEMDPRPLLVGFAAETGPPQDAIAKGKERRVDLLVTNDVTEEGSGFGTETNRVAIVGSDGSIEPWELMPKTEVASRLWDRLQGMLEGDAP